MRTVLLFLMRKWKNNASNSYKASSAATHPKNNSTNFSVSLVFMFYYRTLKDEKSEVKKQ